MAHRRTAVGVPALIAAMVVTAVVVAAAIFAVAPPGITVTSTETTTVTTTPSTSSSPAETVAVGLSTYSTAYPGGCINPSVPVTDLQLDGTPVTYNSTLGYNETRLASGTTHTLTAAQTYSSQCPTGCPECGLMSQPITVNFSYWDACSYVVPTNTTETCTPVSVANPQSSSISITVPTPENQSGLLVFYTAYYSLPHSSASESAGNSSTASTSTVAAANT